MRERERPFPRKSSFHLFFLFYSSSSSAANSPREYEDPDTSVKILESHSAPNLLSVKDSCNQNSPETNTPGWDMREDDSFIKLENMVARLCVSPGQSTCNKSAELNNTLEVIEYILNNPPSNHINNEISNDKNEKDVKPVLKIDSKVLNEVCLKKLQNISPQKSVKVEQNSFKDITEVIQDTPQRGVKAEQNCHKDSPETILNSPQINLKVEQNIHKDSPGILGNTPQMSVKVEQNIHKNSPEVPQNTPVKSQRKNAKEVAGFMTPLATNTKPVFKTPAQPLSLKKPSTTSLKKTPSYKWNAYEHISSPVASYIKNCPIVPLVKDVHPKKPLPGPSSIPKFKNNVAVKASNKENINLPSVAYKSAKKTKVVCIMFVRIGLF